MIQRIQTVYLTIAIIALSVIFFLPISRFFVAEGIYEFSVIKGITLVSSNLNIVGKTINAHIIVLPILIVTILLIIISIFMYKNRVKQMRYVAVAFLLNAILLIVIFYLSDKYGKVFEVTPNYKNIGTIMPIISIVMLLISNKAIKSDEIKMRKSNRLR